MKVIFVILSMVISMSASADVIETSQNLISNHDVDYSGSLEMNELRAAYQSSSIAEKFKLCTNGWGTAEQNLQLWFFVFEFGAGPQSLAEKLKFLMYTNKNHDSLAVSFSDILVAVEHLESVCK